MPWNSSGGNDNNQGPWGDRKQGSWGGGGSQPPDLGDILRKGQDRFRQIFPKNLGFGGLAAGLVIVLVIWLMNGFYRVEVGEQAAVLRFGKWVDTTGPGLRYHFPYPFETVIKKKVAEVRVINSGVDSLAISLASLRKSADLPLMLTKDENIVDTNFTVQWFIKDLGQFLFKARNPEETVKIAAESIVREIMAQTPLSQALTKGRGNMDIKAQELLQTLVDEYKLGIQIQQVLLLRVDAPEAVIESFRDVQRARTDQERLVNEAEAYSNNIIPVAEGEAIRTVHAAEADKAATVAQATGESGHFELVLTQYKRAPEVTKKRIYLDTVKKVLKFANKVFLDRGSKNAQGVLPHMALPAIKTQTLTNKE